MCVFRPLLIVTIVLIGLFPTMAQGISAAGPRRWSVTLTGPDRVGANRDYIYTVVVTNDGGVWPISANTQSFFRLSFDVAERYNEERVGISDIIVHPTGPQSTDGALPCAMQGGCWFTRVGSQIDFVFTKENVKVPAIAFDIVIHTASVFRPGDAFAVSAVLQGGWKASQAVSDTLASPSMIEGNTRAAILAEYPLACAGDGNVSQWRDGADDGCPRSIAVG